MTINFFLRADNNSTHFFLSSKVLLSNFLRTDASFFLVDTLDRVVVRDMLEKDSEEDLGALLLISLAHIILHPKYWKMAAHKNLFMT